MRSQCVEISLLLIALDNCIPLCFKMIKKKRYLLLFGSLGQFPAVHFRDSACKQSFNNRGLVFAFCEDATQLIIPGKCVTVCKSQLGFTKPAQTGQGGVRCRGFLAKSFTQRAKVLPTSDKILVISGVLSCMGRLFRRILMFDFVLDRLAKGIENFADFRAI